MIRAGTRERKTERYIHTFVKRVKLQRDQPLIVIHAKNGVEFAVDRAMENRVGRVRPGYFGFRILNFEFQPFNSWFYDFDFFAAEFAGFARVRI